MAKFQPPPHDCQHCPRLERFRLTNKESFPTYWNGVVPSFGDLTAKLLIVGLAPGLHGANCTGRPFTGDGAGDLLYATLNHFNLSTGSYAKTPDDGLTLKETRITNAVRCVPPQNKPTSDEILNCLSFLQHEISSMPHLRVILCLGRLSHNAVLKTLNLQQKSYPFTHASLHKLPDNNLTLVDSYHCSRYNTNTGRLTQEMFHAVFQKILDII